ncbi:hypothetical protein PVAP13_7NG260700 [Panicum virgatum]|uniref:Polyadenylate-binding protein n=1 Tax=Panicum virgatum TaxID=38727 RepID=A0A8T0Q3L8_PANVG|nr:hypothetical protein PVAP13_7NG260700 [Panicum virgatum]
MAAQVAAAVANGSAGAVPAVVSPGAVGVGVGVAQPLPTTSLYVGDLEGSVSDSQLYELFSQAGQVVSVRVCRDVTSRRSLGYAYVNFSNPLDAARALELLNFALLNNKPIRVMYSNRDPSSRRSGSANIFIKNLDKAIDNKTLHETFSTFGTILSCKVAMDEVGQSKGFGFVQYEKEEEAQAAIKSLNGMLINDKPVYVGPFLRKQERDHSFDKTKFNNVFVKNLSESTTKEDLVKIFGEYGNITSAVVMIGMDGKSRCFGFINFENPDAAARAVQELNGKKINDKEWYVGRAQKKSEREMELKRRFEQTPAIPGVAGGMIQPYDMGGFPVRDAALSPAAQIGTLTSALANATPEQQRTILGENLYPLVEQLEPNQAAKVTGMLLEMDQTEVLHLLESPEALKSKVAEAMDVLRNVAHQQNPNTPTSQLAALSLTEGIIS